MDHKVYWFTLKQPKPKPLTEVISVDVAIVGGGMMGLMCALRLHRQGLKVAVIEKDFCGSGATGKSSGFITPDSEMSLAPMLEKYGEEQAKKLWNFACGGTMMIRETIEEFALPCDYQADDSLFVANKSGGFKAVLQEHEARRRLGYESKLYPAAQLPQTLGTNQYFGGVRYGKTFSMNAYVYSQELKDILEASGVRIFENSEVTRLENDRVETKRGRVHAGHIVVCTDRALPRQKLASRDIYSAQTFLGLSQPLSKQQVTEIFPDGPCMVWDTDLIYQYFRLTPDRRVLIGASSLLYTYLPTYKWHTQVVEKKMQTYWQEKFPKIDLKLEYFWPGLIGVSKDFLPVAGVDRERPNTVFAGGAAGLPWAAALGSYLADKVLKNRSDFDEEFSSERVSPLGGALDRVLPKPLAFALAQGMVKLL